MRALIKPAGHPERDEAHPLSDSIHNGGKPPLLEHAQNWVVFATAASAVISTAAGARFLSPILHAAALLPFYYAAMRRQMYRFSVELFFRWGISLLCSLVIIGAFVPERMKMSVGGNTAAQIEQWLVSAGNPPADFAFLLWGMVAFLAGTAVSGGIAGIVLAAVAIGGAAAGTVFLFGHGNNVISIALAAVPVWQWLFFAAGALLFVPAAMPAFGRFFHYERAAEGIGVLRRLMITGGACYALSLLLRLVLDDTWRSILIRHTTL